MNRIFILVLVVGLMPAAELAVRDIHLGLATRPGDFDFDLSSSSANTSGSDAFDAGLSLEGGLRWSFARTGDSLGLVLGADLATDQMSYDGELGLSTLWARASAGLGWAATDRITVIGEILGGYGLSNLDLPATSVAPSLSASGSAISYETRVTGTWQFTRTFNAGLALGWLITSHDLSGDDVDITIDQGGWYLALLASWRISDTPPGLE